jgi:hypothetical protein
VDHDPTTLIFPLRNRGVDTHARDADKSVGTIGRDRDLGSDARSDRDALADVPAKPADMERILAANRGIAQLETSA